MQGNDDPFAIVVDDSPIVLMDACQILEDAGFNCIEADNGDAAWDMICTNACEVTLLFSDVEMPGGMNGFELAQKVASAYPEIEVVLASGRMKPRDDDLPGKVSFIAKPFSAAIVHDHLKSKLPDDKTPVPLKVRS